MVREIEFSKLDARYEKHRMRQCAAEARLLPSIAERGIIEPLEGVDVLAYTPAPELFQGRDLEMTRIDY